MYDSHLYDQYDSSGFVCRIGDNFVIHDFEEWTDEWSGLILLTNISVKTTRVCNLIFVGVTLLLSRIRSIKNVVLARSPAWLLGSANGRNPAFFIVHKMQQS